MFAMIIERELPRWSGLPATLASWLQNVGTVAAVGIVIWGLVWLLNRSFQQHGSRGPLAGSHYLFIGLAALALLSDAVFAVLWLTQGMVPGQPQYAPGGKVVPTFEYTPQQSLFLTAGGALAVLAVVLPMLFTLVTRMKVRRIWALTRLSIKEAVRGRVIYVFAIMAVIFLFADWFVPFKAEDQLRNYVMVVYWSMAPLFLFMAALLGSFSIPQDVTRQTIHTIVTKPVVRYEIVLGRFFGFGLLLTAGLAALTALSLLYVLRGINPEAARESYKARVPLFADKLTFEGTGKLERGESVGREWEYRSYIRAYNASQPAPRQYAVWNYRHVPAALGTQTEPVPFEFTFDIFRTTKGVEGQRVQCVLTFMDGRLSVKDMEAQLQRLQAERSAEQDRILKQKEANRWDAETEKKAVDKLDEQLIAKYGIYVHQGVTVVDYQTSAIGIPPAIFKAVSEASTHAPTTGDAAQLKVLMHVDDLHQTSRSQLIGVALRDLYLLEAELPFWQNFLKGSIGLWCNVMLVLAIAVTCSTYMSGIVSVLCTGFMFLGGLVVDAIRALAEGRSEGGGPFESFQRLMNRQPLGAQLEASAATTVSEGLDWVYRLWLGQVLKIIPDVHRYNLSDFVANGFDISWGELLFLDNILPLIGYLVPWAVLAYYMINSREVANPT